MTVDPDLVPLLQLIEAGTPMHTLTPAEARLALAVADGLSPTDAAEQLGITVQTARTHLKRVFHKTATTRQAELVKLVLAEFPPVA